MASERVLEPQNLSEGTKIHIFRSKMSQKEHTHHHPTSGKNFSDFFVTIVQVLMVYTDLGGHSWRDTRKKSATPPQDGLSVYVFILPNTLG